MESKSFKDLKILQRPLIWRNVYQSTNPLSIRYKKTRASVRTLIVFQTFFAGPKSSLDTSLKAITNKTKRVELLMLCRAFLQRSQKDL